MAKKIKSGDNIKLVDITEVVSTALDNAAKGRKALAKRRKIEGTTDLLALELQGIKHVKLLKDGTAVPKKSKKGATHKIEGTKLSTLAEPLAKAPKPPKELTLPAPIGAQPDDAPPSGRWHPIIPEGCTYAAFRWRSGNLYMTPVKDIDELKDFRGGELLLGRLRYGEDFRIMWPEAEAGNVIEWKSGRTVFAEGKDPSSIKKQEKAHEAALERKAAGLAPATAAAFKAQTERRKVPAGPRPGDVPGKRQNGVLKPGAGGKTARVWEICDELRAKLGRCPTKAEVFAVSVDKEKASPGMTGTNYSYWKRFHGLTA